jgi:phage shock protein PspC (stress-responsive transcriptional regulator)
MREFQEHNVLTRDDTFLGICEAIGEDFRISPFFLRLALGVMLVWSPLAAIGAYAALGLVVGLSRVIAPNPRRALASAGASAERPLAGDNDAARETLAVAA